MLFNIFEEANKNLFDAKCPQRLLFFINSAYYCSVFCNAKMFVSIFIFREVLLFFSSFLNTKQVNIKIKIHEILSTNYFLKVRSVSMGWITSTRFEWWENAKWGTYPSSGVDFNPRGHSWLSSNDCNI